MQRTTLRRRVRILCGLLLAASSSAHAVETRETVPWLDLPATWARAEANGVVTAIPDDLAPGEALLLLVEPPLSSPGALAQDYQQALADLGPWMPVGEPIEQAFPDGWSFRQGVGVAQLEGTTYTALTVVARLGALRARFWVLADSDDTFNRYQTAFVSAIASVQDFVGPSAAAPPPAPATTTTSQRERDPTFGEGISGVYAGIERGLSASAGSGGMQQSFNPSTGRFESGYSAAAPQVQTQISDYLEVDVFFPDGTYRRRLPVRGLASDMSWERQQQPILWGTWRRQGNQIVVQRGTYATTYTVEDDNTLISDRGQPWIKLAAATAAKLDGSYAREDYRQAEAPRLVLRADGTYEDRGGFLRMVGSAWHLVSPDGDTLVGQWSEAEAAQAMAGGSGTYTFEDFTLTLHDRDGRIWQINAYIPAGESMPSPTRLVINGRPLVHD